MTNTHRYAILHKGVAEATNSFVKWIGEQEILPDAPPEVLTLRHAITTWLRQGGVQVLERRSNYYNQFVAVLAHRMMSGMQLSFAVQDSSDRKIIPAPSEPELLDLLISDLYLDEYHRFYRMQREALATQ